MRAKVIILRGTGTNCDIETAQAFEYTGAKAEIIHINELLKGLKKIENYDILTLPGGFSYGDDISAGKIFALKIKKIKKDFENFINSGRPVLGICNGFQILVKTGYLPENKEKKQKATLFLNDTGHFVCKWVKVRINKNSPCIFTKNLPESFHLPVAHGEGKFITESERLLNEIIEKNLNAISYIENPNGSMANIAGICNSKGNILGLMPHPERAFFSFQRSTKTPKKIPDLDIGYAFFENAVNYVKL